MLHIQTIKLRKFYRKKTAYCLTLINFITTITQSEITVIFFFLLDLRSNCIWFVSVVTPACDKLFTLTSQNSKIRALLNILCITFLFYKITNRSTITINLSITMLPHVSTLSCHLQGARIHYLAKLHNYINCSCTYVIWRGNEY